MSELREVRGQMAAEQKASREQLEQHRLVEERMQANELSRNEQLEIVKQQLDTSKHANNIIQVNGGLGFLAGNQLYDPFGHWQG